MFPINIGHFIPILDCYFRGRIFNMAAVSKLKPMFLILLSLQLYAIFSKKHDGNNGMSMALHMRRENLERRSSHSTIPPTL